MTPPAKKTTKKAPSASKKQAGSSGARRPAKKTGAAGRKRLSKKRKESLLPPLLAACFAALVMAAVCFWGITHINESKKNARLAAVEQSRQKQEAPRQGTVLPRIDATGKTPGKSGARPGTRQPEQGARPEGAPKAADPSLTENEERAIAAALVELQALPYEEPLPLSLDERVRQVDYAMMQAAWQNGLPASRVRLAAVEERGSGMNVYHFQTIDILPGQDSRAYIDSLRDVLKVWVADAVLRKTTANEWTISLAGVNTHHIRLYPGKDALTGDSPKTAPQSPAHVRPAGKTAKMVIVIDDLGESMTAVNRLLRLDYTVSFAFWPHASHVREGAEKAHKKGREILVHLPMEPLGYPKVAPGPGALRIGMSPALIARQVEIGIAAVPHAVGLNNHMGSRFTQEASGVIAVINILKKYNFFMLDSLTHPRSVFAREGKRLGITTYKRNIFLDVTPTREAILEQLRQAERIALLTGESIAIGHPLPETLAALEEWQRLRNRSVLIVRLQDI